MVLRNGMYYLGLGVLAMALTGCGDSDTPAAYSAVQETNEESPSEPENTEEADATEEDAGAESTEGGEEGSTSDIEEALEEDSAEDASAGEEADTAEETETDGTDGSEEETDTEVVLLDLKPGISELTLEQEIKGEIVKRRLDIHVPDNLQEISPDVTLPVYFFFHGNGGQGKNGKEWIGPIVDQGLGVGIYPDGHLQSWNLGKEESTADDVAFVGAIFDTLASYPQLNLDLAFAIGYSNGAGFCHKLAVETDYFRGIASMASVLLMESLVDGALPKETNPLAVLQIHGTEDEVCPYDGGEGVAGHVFVPVTKSAALWALVNECADKPEIEETEEENQLTLFTECAQKKVASLAVVGAGHGIPPVTEGGLPLFIWDFFRDNYPELQIQ